MSCLHVHDFIAGTTITLPRAILERPVAQEGWDILRPNQQASALVARHVQVLEGLGAERKPKASVQASPLTRAKVSVSGM